MFWQSHFQVHDSMKDHFTDSKQFTVALQYFLRKMYCKLKFLKVGIRQKKTLWAKMYIQAKY